MTSTTLVLFLSSAGYFTAVTQSRSESFSLYVELKFSPDIMLNLQLKITSYWEKFERHYEHILPHWVKTGTRLFKELMTDISTTTGNKYVCAAFLQYI